jgi:thiol:disulfide interchange protein DsbD
MRLRMILLCFLWCLPLWSFSAPLPDNQVFQFSFSQFDANTLKVDWIIKEGYFLYREHIWIENSQNKYLHIGVISFPDPETKVSKQGKNILIYRDKLTLAVPVLVNSGGEVSLTVHYQGCSDAGFCYPPQSRDIQLSFDKEHELTQVHADFESEQAYAPVNAPAPAADNKIP